MKTYIRISIPVSDPAQAEILVAQLSEAGFEGFEETDAELLAFAEESVFDESLLLEITGNQGLNFSKTIVEPVNWNRQWEENFKPVAIGDFCVVRAAFHAPVSHARYEVIITPKMSFGTGHHATTYMMIAAMEQLDFSGKSVLDFGTGTGVLAILAAKCGASSVTALDNDPVCIENAAENIAVNNCSSIRVEIDNQVGSRGSFDVIMANINRNIILTHFNSFQQHLSKAGVLLVSGVLETDENSIIPAAKENGFELIFSQKREGWICLGFDKKIRNAT